MAIPPTLTTSQSSDTIPPALVGHWVMSKVQSGVGTATTTLIFDSRRKLTIDYQSSIGPLCIVDVLYSFGQQICSR